MQLPSHQVGIKRVLPPLLSVGLWAVRVFVMREDWFRRFQLISASLHLRQRVGGYERRHDICVYGYMSHPTTVGGSNEIPTVKKKKQENIKSRRESGKE